MHWGSVKRRDWYSLSPLGRDELKGSAGLVPGGEVGNAHAYLDVFFLFN